MLSACCLPVTKGIIDILIICQLYFSVMGEWDIPSTFVLQVVDVYGHIKIMQMSEV